MFFLATESRRGNENHLGACSPYLPVLCLLCEQVTTTSGADHLCPHCRLALPFNQNPCLHCALPLAALDNSGTAICSECLTKPLANRAIAPLIHRHEAAHLDSNGVEYGSVYGSAYGSVLGFTVILSSSMS